MPAKQLAETFVTSQEFVVAGKGNSERRILQDGLILQQQLLERFVGRPAFRDVLGDKNGALAFIGCVDCLGQKAAHEGRAIASFHQRFGIESCAGGENRDGDPAHFGKRLG